MRDEEGHGAPSTSGAPGPKEGGREPHLNLPEDVTTPRRTPGQWEAVTGRGGARRNWAGPHWDSWQSRVVRAGGGPVAGGRRRPALSHVLRWLLPACCRLLPEPRRRGVGGASRNGLGSKLPVARTSSWDAGPRPSRRAGWRWRPGVAAAHLRPGCFCSCWFLCCGPRPGSGPYPTKPSATGTRNRRRLPSSCSRSPQLCRAPSRPGSRWAGRAREGEAAEPAAPGTRLAAAGAPPSTQAAGARRGPRPRLSGVEDLGVCPSRVGPGLARLLMGEGRAELGGHCKPLVREDADAAEEGGVLLIRWILENWKYSSQVEKF